MGKDFITFFGIFFIFFMTILGSSVVFLFKEKVSDKVNKVFIGLSSGIMIAASIWSLLIPAIEKASIYKWASMLPVCIGFILGGLFLVCIDKLIPSDGNKSNRLFLSILIHNIPEGLAVGVAFGSAYLIGTYSSFLTALGLALGIGFQNLPEGAAISLPLKNEYGNRKAFLYGVISGIVEPIAAIIGIVLSMQVTYLMPWLLAFAAGAMIFVVIEELIPESHSKQGTWALMFGFMLMMLLDVLLG